MVLRTEQSLEGLVESLVANAISSNLIGCVTLIKFSKDLIDIFFWGNKLSAAEGNILIDGPTGFAKRNCQLRKDLVKEWKRLRQDNFLLQTIVVTHPSCKDIADAQQVPDQGVSSAIPGYNSPSRH